MMDKKNKKWRELTFSQREGKATLPEPLQAGKLTERFKLQVWYFIDTHINDCTARISDIELGTFEVLEGGMFWTKYPSSYNIKVPKKPHDIIDTQQTKPVKKWIRRIILQGENHEVITLLEDMLRFTSIPQDLAGDIEGCFEFAPYFIDRSSDPPTIVSSTSEEMKESAKRSLENINRSELAGAKSHLSNASQELNSNNFANSIRESIHAVEAAARQIDPKASKTLAPALDSLENHGMLKHPALKDAFKKLYGYTSDAKGIRHSLIDQGAADVGFDEAIFMYAACVSFVDYLASKQRQIEEK